MEWISVATIFLVECVIFVNGWTDAPTAIVSAVSGKALSYRNAVILAAVCNFGGVLLTCTTGSAVAETILELLHFSGTSARLALLSLLCVMLSILIFAVGAWFFGIPTSESHALIGALAGAALAVNGVHGIDTQTAWTVFFGMLLSVLLGIVGGSIVMKFSTRRLKHLSPPALCRRQISTAGCLSFLHGAQDGQKFYSILCLVQILLGGRGIAVSSFSTPLLIALTMGLGTMAGGRRIIEHIGNDLAAADPYTALCSDYTAILGLAGATGLGLPVSTTHCKTASMLGCAMAANKQFSPAVALQILFTWIFTLPACAVLSFFLTVLARGFLL